MSKDGYWYIHPLQNRTLSIREAARVQSFPDGFRFHGTPSNRFHQVGEAVAPLVGAALGSALIEAVRERDTHSDWVQPDRVRQEILRWYREDGGSSLLPWARQKEEGKEIPEELRAWRAFLGELMVTRLPASRQADYWQRLLVRWPDHLAFLSDPEPNRRRTFRSLHLENVEALLQKVAIQLTENLPWKEWVRNDEIEGVGRDRIRQCLAMVGITADRSCSTSLGRLVARVTGNRDVEIDRSRQQRELHLGLMLGGDSDGRIYRSAVAIADRWCGPEPSCAGGPGPEDEACPLYISGHCVHAASICA
jgi:DNA (cytosine-5)-methyltransferase 1